MKNYRERLASQRTPMQPGRASMMGGGPSGQIGFHALRHQLGPDGESAPMVPGPSDFQRRYQPQELMRHQGRMLQLLEKLRGVRENPTVSGHGSQGPPLLGDTPLERVMGVQPRGYRSAMEQGNALTGMRSIYGNPGLAGTKEHSWATAMSPEAEAQMRQMTSRLNSSQPMGPTAGFMPEMPSVGATDFLKSPPDQRNAGAGRRLVVGRDGKLTNVPAGVTTPEQRALTKVRIMDEAIRNRGRYVPQDTMLSTTGLHLKPDSGQSIVEQGKYGPRLIGPRAQADRAGEYQANRKANFADQLARTEMARNRRSAVEDFRQGRIDGAQAKQDAILEADRTHQLRMALANQGINPDAPEQGGVQEVPPGAPGGRPLTKEDYTNNRKETYKVNSGVPTELKSPEDVDRNSEVTASAFFDSRQNGEIESDEELFAKAAEEDAKVGSGSKVLQMVQQLLEEEKARMEQSKQSSERFIDSFTGTPYKLGAL